MQRYFIRSFSTFRMATSTLSIGTSSSASFRVKPTDLASAISTDQPYLEPGQLSVGVTLDVSHTTSTPGDALVTAKATYRGEEGKLFVFDVVASDEGGDVGAAVHELAVVDAQRLLVGAKKRSADWPSQSV